MKGIRLAFQITCGVIFLIALIQVAQAEENSVVAVAQALEKQKQALQERERVVEEREKALQEQEKSLDQKIKELEALRAAVSGELEAQRKNSEDRVIKMVSVFETMAPKSASGILETLDEWLAVEVLKRMETKKMAKIMNIMDRNRSAKLSELMTGYYKPETAEKKPAGQTERVPAASPAPVSDANNAKKGGKS